MDILLIWDAVCALNAFDTKIRRHFDNILDESFLLFLSLHTTDTLSRTPTTNLYICSTTDHGWQAQGLQTYKFTYLSFITYIIPR